MSNHSVVEGLEPQPVWKYFAELSSIPRCSKHEQAAGDYVLQVAARLGLEADRDASGNVIVRKPAASGRQAAPAVCLQGHLDMVCEKAPAKAHDFSADPISLRRHDGFLMADGTTLGADNGIAVATNLALMEDGTLGHGLLEFLFTVDEETGLTGAKHLQPGFVRSRLLLNLDSEEEGELYVGCAGGCDTIGTWPLEHESAPPNAVAIEVTVSGLLGGHSGAEIDKGRGNALKILNRTVMRLTDSGARLARIDGGKLRNAIPSYATAVLVVAPSSVEDASRIVAEMNDIVRSELASVEPSVTIASTIATRPGSPSVLTPALQSRVVSVISALPHGVVRMSNDIPGLVETSTNVAVIETGTERIALATSQRSSVASALDEIADTVASIFSLGGAVVEAADGYPGWKPDLKSPLLKLARDTYRKLFGSEPKVKAVHAGLECGVIGERYPGIDMLSFGPTMAGVHSPDEKIDVASVLKFWNFLRAILVAV